MDKLTKGQSAPYEEIIYFCNLNPRHLIKHKGTQQLHKHFLIVTYFTAALTENLMLFDKKFKSIFKRKEKKQTKKV